MKKFFALALSLVLVLSLTACGGQKAETVDVSSWQEQYDLGIRYLSEGNYEEAIIAFTAAIEIDPKQAEAYIGLADVYTAQGNTNKAMEILNQALETLGENEAISAALEALNPTGPQPLEGYPKTERRDFEDGTYQIAEYNEFGNKVRSAHYSADGVLSSVLEYTYDENQLCIYRTCYDEQGIKVHDEFYDRELMRSDPWSRRVIEYIEYNDDGTVQEREKYFYTIGEATVTVKTEEGWGDGMEVQYTMDTPENWVAINGGHAKNLILFEYGNQGLLHWREVAPDGTILEEIPLP